MADATAAARKLIFEQQAPGFDELKELVRALKAAFEFALARQVLALARPGYNDIGMPDPERQSRCFWITQQQALCTYKDETLHPATRSDQALALLTGIGLYAPENRNAETLALGGAVYKRRFEYTGQLDDLYQSLAFYSAAWQRNPAADQGYGGANAAFVLDLLAARARRLGDAPTEISENSYRERAARLRHELAGRLEEMLKQDPRLEKVYFFVVTLAEVHFGLRDFDRAAAWLGRGRALGPGEWEQQSLMRQLVTIARLQGFTLPRDTDAASSWAPPWIALAHFLGEATAFALGCYRGKIGLALSGGGFRASLFHIGVMARLAEMDVLRCVETLSTVSGGSILGAHYYLALRRLLQMKADRDITRGDYVELVDAVRHEFFAGVQDNLRMRTYANLFANLRMLCSWPIGKYRTVRLGLLYERLLFSRVRDDHEPGTPRLLRELLVSPPPGAPGAGAADAAPGAFNPKFSNWRRRAKVPALVINSTSLNSGHAWHFTAKSMGEPPALVGEEVDMKYRYRRPYYAQMPSAELRDFRLGYAVGASSCVPGVFSPIELKGLYPDRTVRLVDGGVHDNQGVQGLLAEGCNFILCSDASGQMGDAAAPDARELKVLGRANDTLMERVRETEYQHLRSDERSAALGGLFFVHLKKGLQVLTLDWVGCDEPTPHAAAASCTEYGTDRDLQAKLGAIRTDLDVFSEVEAGALMLSGYLMTEHDFKTAVREVAVANGFDVDAPRGRWDFLRLEPLMRSPADARDAQRTDLGLQLGVSSRVLFKTWLLVPVLRWAAHTAMFVLIVLLAYWILGLDVRTIQLPAIELSWGSLLRLLGRIAAAALIAVGVFTLIVNIHICVFDPIYRARGRLRRLLDLERSAKGEDRAVHV